MPSTDGTPWIRAGYPPKIDGEYFTVTVDNRGRIDEFKPLTYHGGDDELVRGWYDDYGDDYTNDVAFWMPIPPLPAPYGG